jgi:hypothetical protein
MLLTSLPLLDLELHLSRRALGACCRVRETVCRFALQGAPCGFDVHPGGEIRRRKLVHKAFVGVALRRPMPPERLPKGARQSSRTASKDAVGTPCALQREALLVELEAANRLFDVIVRNVLSGLPYYKDELTAVMQRRERLEGLLAQRERR